jgi:hypothetical protein
MQVRLLVSPVRTCGELSRRQTDSPQTGVIIANLRDHLTEFPV